MTRTLHFRYPIHSWDISFQSLLIFQELFRPISNVYVSCLNLLCLFELTFYYCIMNCVTLSAWKELLFSRPEHALILIRHLNVTYKKHIKSSKVSSYSNRGGTIITLLIYIQLAHLHIILLTSEYSQDIMLWTGGCRWSLLIGLSVPWSRPKNYRQRSCW